MEGLLLKRLLLFLFCTCAVSGLAQQRREQPVSSNTSINARIEAPNRTAKKVYSIYRTEVKGSMSGNRCIEELSRKMGVRYELIMKKGPGSKTATGIFFHNLGTNIILFFRNGPFWQLRFRKKIQECRKKTGDYMG